MNNSKIKNHFVSRRSFVKTIGMVSATGLNPYSSLSEQRPKYNAKVISYPYKKKLAGPCLSIRTPFDKDGNIDYKSLQKQIEFGLNGGTNSVILTFGDSLISLLTEVEIAELTKACVEIVNKRALVVAATGQWATRKTIEFAEYSSKVGADMLMVLPPDWTSSCGLNTLVQHYALPSEHIPVMFVNNYLKNRPIEFGLSLIKELYEKVPGVVAFKSDVAGELMQRTCLMTFDRWAIIAGGKKQTYVDMLPYGVDGYFEMDLQFNHKIANDFRNFMKKNKLDEGMTLIKDYEVPLFEILRSMNGGFDAGIHGMLEILGIGKRYRRAPYHTLTDKEIEPLRDFMELKGYGK